MEFKENTKSVVKKPWLIVISGPTGIGKTCVAIDVATHFKTCIISADSRQVFREMSIGTAAPTNEELNAVPHYFVKNRSIHEAYNASLYENEVLSILHKEFKDNRLIVLAGGSGLYIEAVCNGIDDLPTIDKAIRDKWLKITQEQGIAVLQKKVQEIDPTYYEQVDKKNPKRLQKAIEIFEMTGIPYSAFLTQPKKDRPFNILKIALNTDRAVLYDRINRRVDQMINDGLLSEVKGLEAYKHMLPLKTVGYKELFDYLDGKFTLEEAIVKIKDHTRAYARRQITWFRRDKETIWFEPSNTEGIIQFIHEKTGI